MSTFETKHRKSTARTNKMLQFNSITAVAAATAAMAAAVSMGVGLPVWAMFVGWVAFFSRGHSMRDGLINYGCVVAGIGFGTAAAVSITALSPLLGTLALPTMVFTIAMIVVSLRARPRMNNVLAYFLGLITFFAAHQEPSLDTAVRLSAAAAIGSIAAWASLKMQHRVAR
jgi:hypothetical protein